MTKDATDRMEQNLVNVANFSKKDQTPEPAPSTIIQTYADRLRFISQQKKFVLI